MFLPSLAAQFFKKPMPKNPFLKKPYLHNRRKKRDNPEGRLQLQIIKALRFKGYFAGKLKNKGSVYKGMFIKDKYQILGLPDILVFGKELVFLEVKVGKNKQTPDQIQFQLLCNTTGVRYHLVYSLEQALRLFP